MPKAWPWTERLRELVSKGPVPMHQAMAEMAVLVPPGRAYRDGKAQTEWSRKNAQKHGRKTVELLDAVDSEVVKNDRIKRGARRLAYQAIWHQKRSGHVEFYAEGDTKMVRLGSIPWEVGSE